eukprot:2926329-Pleurochrysis_carterae.AAC.1
MIVRVVSTKDPQARHKPVPLPVRRRRGEDDQNHDPVCAYDALRLTWGERMHRVPVEDRTSGRPSRVPLFTVEGGTRPWSSADSRALAKRYAALLGLEAGDFGGKCWRIGGATDLRDVLGDAGAKHIKRRGRWGSDVAAVYQRTIVDEQLEAS